MISLQSQQVNTFWSLKRGELRQVCDRRKNDCVNFDVDNVIIGVDIKFEKGFNVEIRFPTYDNITTFP